MKKFFVLTVAALLAASVVAKLPAPSDEAKAKAAEAAAKTAWAGKVDAFQLCKSQDAVVAYAAKANKAAGKPAKVAAATPPCADPGPFVYTPPAPPVAGASAPAATPVAAAAPAAAASAAAPAKKP
jgi:hypothetical protein